MLHLLWCLSLYTLSSAAGEAVLCVPSLPAAVAGIPPVNHIQHYHVTAAIMQRCDDNEKVADG